MKNVQFVGRRASQVNAVLSERNESPCGCTSELIKRARQGRIRALESERSIYMNLFADELRVVVGRS